MPHPVPFARVLLAALLVLAGLQPAPAAVPAPIPKPPDVNARAWLLVDHFSGRVLAENKADERVEPASLTKLMTAYVAFTALREKRLRMDETVRISEHAWRAGGAASGGSTTFLDLNSQVPVDILLKGMIVQSGNDATIAIAERLGGTEPAFAEIMNEYAKRLGMKSTHFDNSEGLPSPTHYTTARDMATLANGLIRDFPEYYSLFSLREFVWHNIRQGNRNGLLDKDPTVDGLKTGHTESAGFCLVTSAKRNDMRLVSVVMGAPSIKAREDASAALLNYGYTFFETTRLRSAREAVLKPRVFKSAGGFATLVVPYTMFVTLPRGQGGSIRSDARLSHEPLIAPLPANTPLGELTVSDAGGAVIARAPLVSLTPVAAGGLWTRASDAVRLWMH